MSDHSGFDFLRFRDGLGAARRRRDARALDPDYFKLDERSLRDLLEFAREFAGTLLYYNPFNQVAGSWSAFLESDPDEMIAFLKDPAFFDDQPQKKAQFSQPHFVLFLTFLALLKQAQAQMNGITRRHLDFYYQQALGLQNKPGRPDQAHVLAQLEPEEDQIFIPKGTLLFAGEDAEGDPILYQVDRELLANQAQIGPKMSLHVEKETTTLAGIREFEKDTGEPEKVLLQLFNIVYRRAGTEKDARPFPEGPAPDRKLDLDLIEDLDALADFIENKLHLRITVFQHLLELFQAWENPLNWHRDGKEELTEQVNGKERAVRGGGMNDYLSKAAKRRNDQFEFSIEQLKDKDFDKNIQAALGVDINGDPVVWNGNAFVPDSSRRNAFIELDGITNFYNLYHTYLRLREEKSFEDHPVYQKIKEFGFEQTTQSTPQNGDEQGTTVQEKNIDEFGSMMKLRLDVLERLKEIIRILSDGMRQAGETPGPANHLEYHPDYTFSNLFMKVCKLGIDDLKFRGWDKGFLRISIPGISVPITEIMDEWPDHFRGEGFMLEAHLENDDDNTKTISSINAALTRELYAHLRTNHPTHFLEIKYGGTAAQSKTTVVLDQNFPQPIGFEVADATGLLTVKLKQARNLASELLEAWKNHAQKGNFEIGAITPTVVFDSQKDELILKGRDKDGEEETYKLDKETTLDQIFAARLPAGKLDKYLKIKFTGPADKDPQVKVLQDESLKDPVRFEVKNELLTIRVRNDQTPSGVLLNAWKKNRRKGRFDLEYVGSGSTGISKTPPGAPVLLEPDYEWFGKIAGSKPDNFLTIAYTGLASVPQVEIVANDETEDPPVSFVNNLESGHLIIKLKQETTSFEEILKAWQNQAPKDKIAFALEAVGPSPDATNISTSSLVGPVEKFNKCSIQWPEKDPLKCLRVAYSGPELSAMVQIEADPTFSKPIDFLTDSAGQLIIRLKNDETPLSDILDEWEGRTFTEKRGFELAYTPELAVFDSETDLARRSSKEISLTKRYSMDFPADQAGDKNFLRIRYTGEFSAPKVKLATHVKTPSGAPIPDVAFDLTYEEISVTDQGGTEIREVFPDEYFKIKGIQLAQVESYFRMQAEDFFFIRDLFKMELGEDWRYKDPAWQWRRADELLENAHRDLFGAEAKPEIVRWKNLYVAPEADQVLAPSFSDEEEFVHWKTFGKAPNPEIPGEAEIIKTGDIGFVITSPALRLTEGRRQLALTLAFDRGFVAERLKDFWGSSEKDPDADPVNASENEASSEKDSDADPVYPFKIEASTEKGWMAVPDWEKFVIGEGTIEITVSLPVGFEPLAPVADDPLSGPWPALKFILEREKIDLYDHSSGFSILKESRRPYELLRELYLSSVSVVATVEGLKNLRVQNLQGDIDPQKPFEPFGPEPAVGDRLYITHPELIAQRLETVTLKAVWNNLPKNGLGAYYESYSILGANLKLPVPQLDNEKFTVEMTLRDRRHAFSLKTSSGAADHLLFPQAADKAANDLFAVIPSDQTFAPGVSYARHPNPSEIPTDILKADRCIEIKLLSQDFQHSRFAELLNLQALAGSPDGVLFETRKVEAVQGTAVKIVQLQGVLAQGLPIEDFTVEYKATTVAEAQAVATAAVEAATASAQAALAGVNTVVTQVKGIAQKVGLQAVDVVPSTIVATAQQIAQEAAKALVEAEKKAAEALADAEGGESNAEDAAPVTITGAAVAEATKTKIEAEDAARKAVVAAAEKQRADKALLDAEAKKATLDGAGDDPKAVEGEVIPLTVTYHDEANSQLRVPDNLPVDMELVISYPGPLLLPDPFTPVMDHISVDYTTSVTVALPGRERTFFADDPPPGVQPIAAAEKTDDRLLHLHPFGVSDLGKSGRWMKIDEDADNGTVTEKLFFRLAPRYEDEGELYLGVENLQPPQSLSLLFQMAEGSSNPDLPVASVEWACLSGDDWTELKGEQILQDTTNGLQNSGIIELALPATASREHTRMPAGIHWLRLRVNRYSASLNNTIDIHTQALRATWLDQGPAAGRLEHTLPAGSIVEPNEPIPGLLDFLQPYSSFGGKAMEQTDTFYLRSSERLRHKKRAVTMWDYERLVLEQFPDIYKVKALAADLLEVGASPGQVAVIVIPDIRFRRPFDPFEPKVPQRQLAEIQQFLQDLAPPFARVQVQNPRFDYLHVRAAVRFHDMNNFNFYADQLQRELKQFLSPWAFDQSAEITFGRDIYLSMVVHFMETRSYVDFIDQPKLILKERLASDGSLRPIKGDAEAFGPGGVARMRGPDVILVTTPDHTIEFLDDSIDPRKRILSGIGYAKLDLDFKVAKNKEDNPG
jgi:hypothetical protein